MCETPVEDMFDDNVESYLDTYETTARRSTHWRKFYAFDPVPVTEMAR
jgi:hypothetical protein